MHDQVQTDELQSRPPHTEPLDTVESTIAESVVTGTEPAEEPHIEDMPTIPLVPPKRYFRLNWWSVIALALLLILVGEHGVPLAVSLANSYFHPTTTVTIFPTSKKLTETYHFLAVTGTADQSQQQIPSRLLSFTTPTKTETINTTGVGHTPPVQATGSITFYNEAPYSQTVYAGTVLTGSDGIQVVTDETVTIAAGNGLTNGSATVSAHTIQAGTQANIVPLDINGLCCLSGILAKNQEPFSGGEDSKAYPMVSEADVKGETIHLAGLLDQVAKQGIQKQVNTFEQFLQPMQCSSTTSSLPKVGEKAEQARVSVAETCTGQVYDSATLQTLTRWQFLHDAGKKGGEHFFPQGTLSIALAKITLLDSRHHTYQLTITAQGNLQFHLTTQQVHAIATQIAGKKPTEAQRELLQLQGVQGVYIQPVSQTDVSLPTDPNQIQIIVS